MFRRIRDAFARSLWPYIAITYLLTAIGIVASLVIHDVGGAIAICIYALALGILLYATVWRRKRSL
jgi:hypothetical protein